MTRISLDDYLGETNKGNFARAGGVRYGCDQNRYYSLREFGGKWVNQDEIIGGDENNEGGPESNK